MKISEISNLVLQLGTKLMIKLRYIKDKSFFFTIYYKRVKIVAFLTNKIYIYIGFLLM